jgi:hypothetical protein
MLKHKAQETAILRRRRRKMILDDFDILDMIGKVIVIIVNLIILREVLEKFI